jgi:hypothetical protein
MPISLKEELKIETISDRLKAEFYENMQWDLLNLDVKFDLELWHTFPHQGIFC